MTVKPSKSAALHVSPGDKIGRYEVVEQVGIGGMSIVWKGYDRLLDRHVALKQLTPNTTDLADVRERFLKEVKIQKRVAGKHKFLVDVLDVIDDGDTGLFLAMAFVDGPSLEQVLEGRPAPFDEQQALGIVAAVAAALEALHAEGVLHRDLKPSNILLPRTGGICITDFGLATLVEEQDVLAVGTVRYMAPEMFSGSDIDARADIYALGMIAYEMLAGREKFNEAFKLLLRDERNQGMRWMKWHTNPRVAAQPLSKLNPKVPETLSDLVARMMEKDPAVRIASATDLLAAIKRHFVGEQKQVDEQLAQDADAAVAMASKTPTAVLPKRSRLPLILGIILGVQAVVLGGIYLKFQADERQVRDAVLQTQRQSYIAAFEDFTAGDYARAQRRFQSILDEGPVAANVRHASEAHLHLSIARAHMDAGRFEEAIEAFDRADDVVAQHRDQTGTTRDSVRRQRDEAVKLLAFEQTVEAIERYIERRDFVMARQTIRDARDVAATEDERQRLLELGTTVETMQTRADITRFITAAEALAERGERDQAIELLEQAIRRYPGSEMDEMLTTLRDRRRFEELLRDADRLESAGQLIEGARAVEEADAILPSESLKLRMRTLSAQYHYDRGLQHLANDDIAGAQAAFTRSRVYRDTEEVRQQLSAIESSRSKADYIRRARQAESRGDYAEAIQHYEDALRIEPDTELEQRLTRARVLVEVASGQRALAQGQVDVARQAFERALAMDADADEARAGLDAIRNRERYRELVSEGDRLRNEGDFATAKRRYLSARQIRDSEEVVQKIRDVEYQQLVATAKTHAQSNVPQEWRAARAHLQTAMRIHETEEARELLAEVERKLGIAGER